MTPQTYRYNPACLCPVCENKGVPPDMPDKGHAYGYEANTHTPPLARTHARIIALLSWYDEPTEWLERCIDSLGTVPVDHLIALDGSYDLYDGPPESPLEQYASIRQACVRQHLSFEIHGRDWTGNEIEKRNHLFGLAEQAAGPGDWYMVVDGDEFVRTVDKDPHSHLERTPFHVGAVTLNEPGHPGGTITFATFPMFFRAIPGLRCVGDHFTYTTPDGRKLWGDAKRARLEPRADLTGIVVEHHNQLRYPDRRRAAMNYYEARDATGIEGLPDERFLTA
jgi:hypothetical protein